MSFNMFFNFVHSKDGEIYIYDGDGKEIALAEYMQQHCELNKEMDITVDDMLSGELCMGCASCPCYSLLLACMQTRSLQGQNDILIRRLSKGFCQ